MKKNILISAALACVAFSSCQQENLGGNGAELDGFRVHTEDMTKAVLDGVKVVFEDADAIDIYADAAETPAVYSYNKANDLFVATGTEAEGEEYTAIFPSTATNPSRSTIYISNRQVATVNSFPKNSMYMAGVSNSKEMTLKHLTGLWEIDLLPQYDGQKLVRASLTMNGGQKINGNFEVDFTDNSLTYIDGGNSSILLAEIAYVMTAGVPVKLYFALPEGKYEGGFTFTATMTDGTTMEVTSPSTINIARGQITKVKNDVAYRLFASGTGTESDPYVIKGIYHWNNMVRKINTDATNYASAYYKVESDIDFANEAVTPIKNFSGVIDGGNYTLKNAKIGDGTASHQAFFYMLNGTVKNLKFDNITVTGGNASSAASSAAVITAGNSSVAFTIENCHVSNSTIVSGPQDGENGGSYAAGLVGRCNNADAIIRNCSVTNSTIKSIWANAGGVVGYVGNGLVDGILSSNNTVTAENSSFAGGVVAGMGGGTLINIVSKDNVCSVKTTSCGGVVGVCSSNDAKIINVLSDGNTVKSMSNQNIPCLGLILGTDGSTKTTLLANGLVLSGLASYVFTPTINETDPSKSKLYAGCIGIVMGYPAATIDNCFYNRNYRSKFDTDFTEAAQSANELNYYRMAIGQKRNIITNASWAGYDDANTTAYLDAPLTDGTCLQQLNAWVDANKATYPSLKSWAARTSGKTYPEIVLEETATSGVNSLNIVESNY
ncbi:MAG: hypothetical protein E7123_07620 [Bacteroidales bacterium]|nr:hypothetical protein [Bacteroidales bacterium]